MTTARKIRRTLSPLDRKIAAAVEALHGLVQMSPEWEAQVMVVRALRAEKDVSAPAPYVTAKGEPAEMLLLPNRRGYGTRMVRIAA